MEIIPFLPRRGRPRLASPSWTDAVSEPNLTEHAMEIYQLAGFPRCEVPSLPKGPESRVQIHLPANLTRDTSPPRYTPTYITRESHRVFGKPAPRATQPQAAFLASIKPVVDVCIRPPGNK